MELSCDQLRYTISTVIVYCINEQEDLLRYRTISSYWYRYCFLHKNKQEDGVTVSSCYVFY